MKHKAVAICSQCGSPVEYDDGDEFAYCPMCENDQVEIKQNPFKVGKLLKSGRYPSGKEVLWVIDDVEKVDTPKGRRIIVIYKECICEENDYNPRFLRKIYDQNYRELSNNFVQSISITPYHKSAISLIIDNDNK